MELKIKPVGDEALVAEFGNIIDEKINMRVHEMSEWLDGQHIKGVKELLPTFRSLMIFYSPDEIGYGELKKRLKKFKPDERKESEENKKVLLVPCCYGRDYGPDLSGMAKELSLTEEEIIALHCEKEYKIYMLGFLPGFVYLGGLDKRICIPRLETPRASIPARSVGIGGDQTGVYPISSPGGWRLIGSTPLEFYDPRRSEPSLCKAGEYIRFVPVNKYEYEVIRKDVIEGTYKMEIVRG